MVTRVLRGGHSVVWLVLFSQARLQMSAELFRKVGSNFPTAAVNKLALVVVGQSPTPFMTSAFFFVNNTVISCEITVFSFPLSHLREPACLLSIT